MCHPTCCKFLSSHCILSLLIRDHSLKNQLPHNSLPNSTVLLTPIFQCLMHFTCYCLSLTEIPSKFTSSKSVTIVLLPFTAVLSYQKVHEVLLVSQTADDWATGTLLSLCFLGLFWVSPWEAASKMEIKSRKFIRKVLRLTPLRKGSK